MTPIEHYWPPEMLAKVFPAEYGHLSSARLDRIPVRPETSGYTVQVLEGCTVFWLSKKEHRRGGADYLSRKRQAEGEG